jgi:hypothetical protein
MAMINLALAGQGRKEIAQALDITPEGVGTIMRSPVFQDELARRREELNKEVNQRLATIPEQAKKELEDAALTAARTHIDLLNPDTCPASACIRDHSPPSFPVSDVSRPALPSPSVSAPPNSPAP